MIRRFQCRRPLDIFDANQLDAIHIGSLRVLSEMGLHLEDAAAMDLLEDHGCTVDREKMAARMPGELVMRAAQMSPDTFVLRGRCGCDVHFGGSAVQFGPCSGMRVMDPLSGEVRPGTLADAARTARLADALDIFAGTNAGLGYLADCPREANLVWQYASNLRNSSKVFSLGAMEDSVKWGIRMARAAGQDVIVPVTSSSPLGWSAEQLDAVRHATAAGLPVAMQSMASPGTSAPVTLAGTAVMMNAEILGLNTLVQLLRPGTGIMYSCFTLPMDMRTANLASGSMEMGLLMAASAQLSRRYRVGNMVWAPMTDANAFDQQAGYEKAMGWLLAAQAGINLIWGAGMVENHAVWSDAQMVVDAEMCGMAGRFMEGVTVTPDTLAVEVMKSVGHFPNNFLESDHTFAWFRREHYLPLVSSRLDAEAWREQGAKGLLTRAAERAAALLRDHLPDPLPADVDREVEDLLRAAVKEATGV